MLFWWGARRAWRDAETAAWVDDLRASAYASRGQAVIILQVYQRVKRGTKAYVQLDGQPWTRDAFFWWVDITAGSMVLVHASTGWGPHTNRDDVLWIGSEDLPAGAGIFAVIASGDLKRWKRHYRRLARNG